MDKGELELITAHNIMYKTLGFKWLREVLCPASAFATADRDEARNPQRIHTCTVSGHLKTKSPFYREMTN
jgi:hypothetical protein